MRVNDHSGLPSKRAIASLTDNLVHQLFPLTVESYYRYFPGTRLYRNLLNLLKPLNERLRGSPEELARDYLASLQELKTQLEKDAAFISESDPAATSIDEVILTYPGFYAMLVYRLAHKLSEAGVPLIPRVMTELAHSRTGIDIHPKANIGSPFCIDHGTGIVIGETTVIGKRVKLYQGVTLGALSVEKDHATTKRHPDVEDDVVIYAGSTILGGCTTIGHDSIIGGNVWLTHSVPPFSLVYHENVMKVRERSNNGA